jgi:drug/metabolite transporter (DMT)-like permease
VLDIAGVALMLGGNGFAFGVDKLFGIALALSCAILFALGNVLNRKQLPIPPLVVVAWQVGLGCLLMLILGVLFERPNYAALTPAGAGSFIYMMLIPMGVCYVTWFETLRRLPPTSASTGMLLVPVIGVVSAAIILGEPLGLREVAAMVLTLGGVTLALQRG